MAGGVALNCVMNARLRDRGPFRRHLGAARRRRRRHGARRGALDRRPGARRRRAALPRWTTPSSARAIGDDEIEAFLTLVEAALSPAGRRRRARRPTILAQDQVIGWFQGRMEFGPRALGARSILASPIHAEMQARLNEIKDREDFRPVAPVVLEEEAADWFVGAGVSPFMLFVYDVRPEKADRIPAVRHVDGTARIQTINRAQNPLYYDLIRAFAARGPACRCWSTPRSTRAASRSSARRATRSSASGPRRSTRW